MSRWWEPPLPSRSVSTRTRRSRTTPTFSTSTTRSTDPQMAYPRKPQAKVTDLFVVCDLASETPGENGGTCLHFKFGEFARLNNGMSVLLREDRGFTSGPLTIANMLTGKYTIPDIDPWAHETADRLRQSVLAAIDPDDPEQEAQDIADRLRSAGFMVDLASVRAAPWSVEFGERVRQKLDK